MAGKMDFIQKTLKGGLLAYVSVELHQIEPSYKKDSKKRVKQNKSPICLAPKLFDVVIV